jgi:hypothetical protein
MVLDLAERLTRVTDANVIHPPTENRVELRDGHLHAQVTGVALGVPLERFSVAWNATGFAAPCWREKRASLLRGGQPPRLASLAFTPPRPLPRPS